MSYEIFGVTMDGFGSMPETLFLPKLIGLIFLVERVSKKITHPTCCRSGFKSADLLFNNNLIDFLACRERYFPVVVYAIVSYAALNIAYTF